MLDIISSRNLFSFCKRLCGVNKLTHLFFLTKLIGFFFDVFSSRVFHCSEEEIPISLYNLFQICLLGSNVPSPGVKNKLLDITNRCKHEYDYFPQMCMIYFPQMWMILFPITSNIGTLKRNSTLNSWYSHWTRQLLDCCWLSNPWYKH